MSDEFDEMPEGYLKRVRGDIDSYEPATDPGGDRPGGDRVTFEVGPDGQENSIFGGSSASIEKSILASTERNVQIIGRRIMGVGDIVGDLGDGTLQEITLHLDNGTSIVVQGIALEVKIK